MTSVVGRKRKLVEKPDSTVGTHNFLHVYPANAPSETFLAGLRERLIPDKFADLFAYLLDSRTSEFFQDCWEQKPCYFPRNVSGKVILSELLTKKSLINVVKRAPLPYESNFNILRYDGIDRELWNTADSEYPEADDIKEMFTEGFTVQFFQPQRFSDGKL